MRSCQACPASLEFHLWVHVDVMCAPSNLGEGRHGGILAGDDKG